MYSRGYSEGVYDLNVETLGTGLNVFSEHSMRPDRIAKLIYWSDKARTDPTHRYFSMRPEFRAPNGLDMGWLGGLTI